MKNNEKQNGVVTLQIKLTRAEHNKASRAKGTEKTWACFIIDHAEYLLKKRRE
jgi:hypothetical protein